ncbi:MAG: hypothetical protein U1F25_08725 [Rubrivivax sp.]
MSVTRSGPRLHASSSSTRSAASTLRTGAPAAPAAGSFALVVLTAALVVALVVALVGAPVVAPVALLRLSKPMPPRVHDFPYRAAVAMPPGGCALVSYAATVTCIA